MLILEIRLLQSQRVLLHKSLLTILDMCKFSYKKSGSCLKLLQGLFKSNCKGIYQGAWTVIGWFAGNVLDPYQIDAMSIVGGLLLIGIALRLLDIKKIAIANLLPALFLAPLVAFLAHSI